MPKSKLIKIIDEQNINNKKFEEKKAASRATSTAVKKVVSSKKNTVKNKAKNSSAVTKVAAKKETAAKGKSTSKNKSTKKRKSVASSKKSTTLNKSSFTSNILNKIVEYYDLPYTYDKTNVKVLYQNPNTLFVYWDVSKKDIANFKLLYGENFLKITSPVLIVHNKTNDYTFEIPINDFANNWYIHVNDSKCKYEVKLGRRPSQGESIKNEIDGTYSNYVEIKNSNTIEMPNDHVLFYKDNQVLTFKNIKNNSISKYLYRIGSAFNKKAKAIYSNYELNEIDNSFDFRNPSSNNPSSNVARKE